MYHMYISGNTDLIRDMAFYPQTTNANAPPRVLKFQSDINLSKDSRTIGEWQEFSDRNGGQNHWNEVRLSLLMSHICPTLPSHC